MLETATDPRGFKTSYAYDTKRRVERITEAVGDTASPSAQRLTTIMYHDAGNIKTIWRQQGYTPVTFVQTSYAYDGLNRPTRIVQAFGEGLAAERTHEFKYDTAGNLSADIDQLTYPTTVGETPVYDTTSYSYDKAGLLVRATETTGSQIPRTSLRTFDNLGSIATETDPLQRLTSYGYDAIKRQVRGTQAKNSPAERAVRSRYDLVGNEIRRWDALGVRTDLEYDVRNRATTMIEAVATPQQRTSTMLYDGVGNLLAGTHQQSPSLKVSASYSYDAFNRRTSVTQAADILFSGTASGGGLASLVQSQVSWNVNEWTGRKVVITGGTLQNQQRVIVSNTPNTLVVSSNWDSGQPDGTSQFQIKFAEERRETTAYDPNGNVLSVTRQQTYGNTPTFVTTSYQYDALNRRTKTIDGYLTLQERVSTVLYDAADNVVSETHQQGYSPLKYITTTHAYDKLDRRIETTRAVGQFTPQDHRTTMKYDAAGNLEEVTDPLNRKTTFAYDTKNRQVSQTEAAHLAVGNPLRRTTRTAYDAADNVVSRTDGLGRKTHYGYDGLQRQFVMVDALKNTEFTELDPMNNVTARLDTRNIRELHTYDFMHRRKETLHAVSFWTTMLYDLAGNVTGMRDWLNILTEYKYDALDRQVVKMDALTRRTTTVYDAADNVTAITNARGYTTEFQYDALDRKTVTIDAAANRTTTLYDAAGNVTGMRDARNNLTTYVYDALDRRVEMIDANNKRTTTIYDLAGNVTGVKVPLDVAPGFKFTEFQYDALDRKTVTIDARNFRTTVLYDLADNVLSVEDAIQNITVFEYDALNRKIRQTEQVMGPTSKAVTFSYDAAGNLVEIADRLGRFRAFAYDAFNRVVQEFWTNGPNYATAFFFYDANGNLYRAYHEEFLAGPRYTYTFTYDVLNRLESVEEPFNQRLTFTYDEVGNRTRVEDSKGGVRTSTYDAVNRVVTMQFSGNGVELRDDFTYTGTNQVETARRYSNLTGTALVGSSTYSYDQLNRLENLQHRGPAPLSALLANYTYTYDSGSRLTAEILDGVTVPYNYDVTDQLTVDGPRTYGYDGTGNRTGTTVGAGNRLQNDGVFAYSYDDEGHLTKKTQIATQATWRYGYDARNHLVKAELRAADNDTLPVLFRVEYKYDAFGNRIERSVDSDGDSPLAPEITRFAYDGWKVHQDALGNQPGYEGLERFDVWADLDGAATPGLKTRYLQGDQVDELLARVDISGATGTTAWYLTDKLGSVRQVTNGAGGLTATVTYDAFGKVLTVTGEAQLGRFRWTGREFDSETGLQHNRARPYDPFTGRFISQDPRGLAAGDTNLYRYVFNGPTNGTDPSGEIAPLIIIGIGLLVLGGAAYGYSEWNRFSRENPNSRWALPDWARLREENENFLRLAGQWTMLAGITLIAPWYTATAVGLSAAETGIEYGLHQAWGQGDFDGVDVFRRNLIVNLATGRLGAGRRFFVRAGAQAVARTGVETAYDVAFRSRNWQDALRDNAIANTLGSFVIGPGLNAAVRYGVRPAARQIGRGVQYLHRNYRLELGINSSALGIPLPTRVINRILRIQDHHIASNQGNWEKVFRYIFDGAHMRLNDAINRIRIPGHVGPHGLYNVQVYRRLINALEGFDRGGAGYRRALRIELAFMRKELRDATSPLGALIRARASRAEVDLARKFAGHAANTLGI